MTSVLLALSIAVLWPVSHRKKSKSYDLGDHLNMKCISKRNMKKNRFRVKTMRVNKPDMGKLLKKICRALNCRYRHSCIKLKHMGGVKSLAVILTEGL